MQSVKELIDSSVSPYTGSEMTRDMVAQQIKERYGETEATNYDPYKNCLTFRQWLSLGFRVNKGEKAIRSLTYCEKKDEAGNVVKKFPRKVFLFYYKQVSKLS